MYLGWNESNAWKGPDSRLNVSLSWPLTVYYCTVLWNVAHKQLLLLACYDSCIFQTISCTVCFSNSFVVWELFATIFRLDADRRSAKCQVHRFFIILRYGRKSSSNPGIKTWGHFLARASHKGNKDTEIRSWYRSIAVCRCCRCCCAFLLRECRSKLSFIF